MNDSYFDLLGLSAVNYVKGTCSVMKVDTSPPYLTQRLVDLSRTQIMLFVLPETTFLRVLDVFYVRSIVSIFVTPAKTF